MPIHLPLRIAGPSLQRARACRFRAAFSEIFLMLATAIACVGLARPARAAPDFAVVPDTRPLVPTVILKAMENGELIGEVRGDVRLFLGGDQILPNGSGAFRVPAGILKNDVKPIAAPEGMHFVASRRGKRFYPVTSKQAQGLSPKNRIYFQTEEAAKAAGYR